MALTPDNCWDGVDAHARYEYGYIVAALLIFADDQPLLAGVILFFTLSTLMLFHVYVYAGHVTDGEIYMKYGSVGDVIYDKIISYDTTPERRAISLLVIDSSIFIGCAGFLNITGVDLIASIVIVTIVHFSLALSTKELRRLPSP